MAQKGSKQTKNSQAPQQTSSQVESSQSSSKSSILALIIVPIIVAIIGAAGVIWAANIQRGGTEPPSTPNTSGMTSLTFTPTPTPIPLTFVHGNFNVSSDCKNKVSLSVTQGDLLIVAVTQYERALVSSNPVTDDKSDIYQKIDSVNANPRQQQDYAELYYAQNAKGGFTTITVSFTQPSDSNGGDTSLGLYEYRGLGSLDTELATTSTDANSKILTESSKLNTMAASEMWFALGIDSGPQNGEKDDTTITEGNGYTLHYPTGNQITDAANGERFYIEDAFVSPGGCKPNFTIAYPSYWGIIGATSKP